MPCLTFLWNLHNFGAITVNWGIWLLWSNHEILRMKTKTAYSDIIKIIRIFEKKMLLWKLKKVKPIMQTLIFAAIVLF